MNHTGMTPFWRELPALTDFSRWIPAAILLVPSLLLAWLLLRTLRNTPQGLSFILSWAEGLGSLLWLLIHGPAAIFTSWISEHWPGSEPVSMGELLTRWSGGESAVLQRLFTITRAFVPNFSPDSLLKLRNVDLGTYEHDGVVFVTRFQDVREVAARDDAFEVMYEPRMRDVTGGENFLLGMANTPQYTRDISNMRLVFRREDKDTIRSLSESRSRKKLGKIIEDAMAEREVHGPFCFDVAERLIWPLTADVALTYFGLTWPDPMDRSELIQWQSDLFEYIFTDLTKSPDLKARFPRAAQGTRNWIDECIKSHPAQPSCQPERIKGDTVLDRCLRLKGSGTPGMEDLDIRNNLIGFLVGALAPIANGSLQVLDVLLHKPEALAQARRAAIENQDELLERCVMEALRFHPNDPVLYRRAVRDATIAEGTWRAQHIRRNTMVFAWTASAMFDRTAVRQPNLFRTDRPADEYFHFGFGQHTCAGIFLTKAMIPGLLKPLLQQPLLKRAPGKDGQINRGESHFVQHLWIETRC